MYDTAKFGGDLIVDIARTHPVLLVGGVLQENPFYVPPDEFLAELRSREARSRAAGVAAGAAGAVAGARSRYRDVPRLADALGHLVALGALSALEAAREPPEVAEHFAQAMISLPAVEMACVRSDFPPHWSGIEVLSARESLRPSPAAADVERIVAASQEPGNAEARSVAGTFAGLGAVSLFVIPLGALGRYGWVAAGSRERSFPDPLQRALLEVGAQQLAAALRNRHLADVRAAAMARRDTEERTRLAFENAAVGMAVLTPEGRFRQVNPALCRILGRPEKDLLGVPWQSVTYPDDVPRMEDAMRRLVSGEANSEILVKRGTHPDGKIVWVQNSLSIARDDGGHPLHLVVLIEDITEQKRAEDGLRLLEARFATMFRNSPAAQGMANLRTGRIIDVNDHWLELFGYRHEEVIGRNADELGLWADPDERPEVIDRVLRHGSVRDLATHFRRQSGELRAALLSFVRTEIPGEDEPVLIAMIVDETERRRAEGEVRESRERLAALSERVVNLQETERREMARELHDQIGQFLTGLRFMIEAPRAGGREEMLSVVNELIARVSDLSMNLRPPMLDELGLLPALLWQVERFEAQTGIQVDFRHANLDRRFGPQVEITAFRIVQEALTNVARHAGVMSARVEVWADGETLGARIEDEGRGFDAEHALGRYSSGLAGMRERCRLLGGQLSIESAPGAGTRLVMTLPLSAVAAHGAGAGAGA